MLSSGIIQLELFDVVLHLRQKNYTYSVSSTCRTTKVDPGDSEQQKKIITSGSMKTIVTTSSTSKVELVSNPHSATKAALLEMSQKNENLTAALTADVQNENIITIPEGETGNAVPDISLGLRNKFRMSCPPSAISPKNGLITLFLELIITKDLEVGAVDKIYEQTVNVKGSDILAGKAIICSRVKFGEVGDISFGVGIFDEAKENQKNEEQAAEIFAAPDVSTPKEETKKEIEQEPESKTEEQNVEKNNDDDDNVRCQIVQPDEHENFKKESSDQQETFEEQEIIVTNPEPIISEEEKEEEQIDHSLQNADDDLEEKEQEQQQKEEVEPPKKNPEPEVKQKKKKETDPLLPPRNEEKIKKKCCCCCCC
jgi:hypothetical protein